MKIRPLMAVVALVTALLAGVAGRPVRALAAEGCADVLFIGVHGVDQDLISGEEPFTQKGNLNMGPTMYEVFKDFKKKVQAQNPDANVGGFGVNYKSIGVGQLLLELGAGKVTGGLVKDNVDKGVDALKQEVTIQTRVCPGFPIVLAGYSEGAWVIDKFLHDNSGLVGAITAVALFADPQFDHSASGIIRGAVNGDGAARTFFLLAGKPPHPVYPFVIKPYLPVELNDRAASWCLAEPQGKKLVHDPVCNYQLYGKNKNETVGLSDCLWSRPSCVHFGDHYKNAGYLTAGADFLVSKVPSPGCSSGTCTAVGWGANDSGQLGDGTTTSAPTPMPVNGLTGVTAIAAGSDHSLAVRNDGTVWAWGSNSSGKLGDGTTTNASIPVKVSDLNGVTAIAAGSSHSLAVRDDGTVWAWGFNRSGQLGNGTTTNASTPVQVSRLTGATAVAASIYHSLALRGDGTVWAWGEGQWDQLGSETTHQSLTPLQVSSLTGTTAIAAGEYHNLAIRDDGTVWAWGGGWWGQLGGGTTTTQTPTPVQVNGLTGATAIAAAGNHSLAVRDNGTVWAWGNNGVGQLGDPTTSQTFTPVPVNGLTGATAVAAAGNHSLAVHS